LWMKTGNPWKILCIAPSNVHSANNSGYILLPAGSILIKSTGFRKKSGAFLAFRGEMENLKLRWGQPVFAMGKV